MSDKKPHDQGPAPGINPSVQSSKGEVKTQTPSTGASPSSGTPEEREQARQINTEASRHEARGAGDLRFTSYPQNEAAQNPAAWEGAHGDRSLRCNGCDWSVSGKSEEEVLGYLRAHARQAHGKSEFTPAELENARRTIHRRAA